MYMFRHGLVPNQAAPLIACGTWYIVCWGRKNLCCVALAVSFVYRFQLSCGLICCTDWTVILISLFLGFVLCWTLNCWQQQSRCEHHHAISRYQTLKSKICLILFQENCTFYLQNNFQCLNFKHCGEMWLGNTGECSTDRNTWWLPYSSRAPGTEA